MIDYYAQQIRSLLNKNLIHFPIITEIARSTLILSELFVDRNQYRNALNLFIDLQKIVENYDDENHDHFDHGDNSNNDNQNQTTIITAKKV